jgi:ParB family chromosome partitioning protein
MSSRIGVTAKKRGLGKSLSALLGSGAAVLEAEEPSTGEQMTHLAIDRLQPGKYQPRRDMDPAALEELANSIRAQGVIQPIVARKLPNGRYEIIAGERRWRASQLAGLTTVPALVRDIPDEAAVAIALIENIQRESLNPIEEAFAMQRLLDEFSMTHQAVAAAVGKSRASVTNLLRLLSLAEPVRLMLERGDIEMGHARALLTLTAEQQLNVAQLIVHKGWSVREAEDHVRRLQMPKSIAPAAVPVPDLSQMQQDLADRLGMGVQLACNAKGRGRLVIRYDSLDELDSILGYFQ